MRKKYLLGLGFVVVMACSMLLCNLETASGPTPYTVFSGQTSSVSSVPIGTGAKTFIIPKSLALVGTGRTVTITAISDTSKKMKGVITSYNNKTGDLLVNVITSYGTGTSDNWIVVLGKTDAEVQDSIRQAYANLKFGMFLHFNMSTFDRCCCSDCYSVSGEWGLGSPNGEVDVKKFNPTKLDCGQWADVAKSAGCKYMVLTTKHHDGFCLWPSKYTEYCVKNAGNNTDVLKAFVDSARTRGLKVGFYYSIRDLTNGYKMDFVKGQLTELLTNYGDIICLWYDGWGWGPGYNRVPYDEVKSLIKRIQPACLIVENNHEFTTVHSEMIEYEMPLDGPPKQGNIKPAEGNEPIRTDACWFWHPDKSCDLKSAQQIFDQLKQNNSRNASYLLDLTPDTTGRIPDCQAARMKEVGALNGVPQ